MPPSTRGDEQTSGFVSLVGAGPGDPGLVTRKGLDRLRSCQILIHDRLIPAELLREVADSCEVIDVGKQPRQPKHTQDSINRLLVEKALEGKRVVRLKGGDPAIFGRSGEEIAALSAAGIPVEIVPGITAASAAAAALGIPLTHRQLSSSVTFATAHEDPEKLDSLLHWSAFAQGGTLVFYMVGGRIPSLARRLLEEGMDRNTPAAIVIEASRPSQSILTTDLESLAQEKIVFDPGFPAVLLIGGVVGLVPKGILPRPLEGIRLVLTHPISEEDTLRRTLLELGTEVLECPGIEIVPPEDPAPMRAAIGRLGEFDWLLLTSKNAVDALADAMADLGCDSRGVAGCRIGVVGSATARRLWDRLRLQPDVVPGEFTGESLAEKLVASGEVSGRKFLFPCSEIAREDLPKRIEEAGGLVDRVTAYRTVTPSGEWPCRDRLKPGQVQGVVFTSSSTVTGFREKLGEEAFAELFKETVAFSIGKKTSGTLRELGVSNLREAGESSFEGLVEAILETFR